MMKGVKHVYTLDDFHQVVTAHLVVQLELGGYLVRYICEGVWEKGPIIGSHNQI